MKKNAKIVLLSLVALVIAGSLLTAAILPLQVEAVQVAPAPASLSFTEQGSYGYERTYTVYPLVAGEVIEVRVKEGQTVREGDVLAVISASDYRHQIEQLNSAVAGYNGQISNVWLQEQQRKAELQATLESLKGQLTSLEGEQEQLSSGSDSLEVQISIQEDVVRTNRNHVSHTRDNLKDARDYGDDLEIEQARQAFNTAQNTLSQSELLLEQLRSGNVSDKVIEGQSQSLQAQIDSVTAQLNKSYAGGMYQYYNAQIEAANASITQMEEKAGQAELRAPTGGVVSKLPLGDQNLITQAEPAAYIGANPCVEVFVPVREIGGVAVGDTVELIQDRRLGAEDMTGTVIQVDDEAQIKLSALGVEERRVRVLIRPEGEGLNIGYDLDVRFTLESWDEAFSVPKTAIFSEGGEDFVWLLEDGKLRVQKVVKGVETEDAFLIDEGLKAGDFVVADSDNGDITEGKNAKAI